MRTEEVTCPELETANVPGTEVGVVSVVVVVVDIDVNISQDESELRDCSS